VKSWIFLTRNKIFLEIALFGDVQTCQIEMLTFFTQILTPMYKTARTVVISDLTDLSKLKMDFFPKNFGLINVFAHIGHFDSMLKTTLL